MIIALGNVDDLKAFLNDAESSDITPADIAAVDGRYAIGDLEIPPVTMGMLPLLEVIRSPFVGTASAADDVDITRTDLVHALYIIVHGVAVVQPLAAVAAARAAAERHKAMAADNPDMYAVFLRHINDIELPIREFQSAALTWWTSLDITDWVAVEQTVSAIFQDLYSAVGEAADDRQTYAKKNNISPASGWAKCWTWLSRPIRSTRTMFSGANPSPASSL